MRIYMAANTQSMWTCHQCGESSEDQFDRCWRCSSPKTDPAAGRSAAATRGTGRRLTFRAYRGTLASWEELFRAAAWFASDLGPERVLNISHSVDDGDGVVTVWYWTGPEHEDASIVGV